MSHISSVLMKPSTYFANDILVCNFAPQGSMNVSGFERDIPRKPLQNNVLVFEFDRVLYGAKEWVNFIENIQFQNIDNVKNVSVRDNGNEIWTMQAPFIVNKMNCRFPFVRQFEIWLTLDCTKDVKVDDIFEKYSLSFDFGEILYGFFEHSYEIGQIQKMPSFNGQNVIYFVLRTPGKKVTQIDVQYDSAYEHVDVYIDYEGHSTQYNPELAKKSFAKDHWSFPETNKCTLHYKEPVDFSQLPNPLLVMKGNFTRAPIVHVQYTSINSFIANSNNGIDLLYK